MELAKEICDVPIAYSTAASVKEIRRLARNMTVATNLKRIDRKPFRIIEKGLRSDFLDAVSGFLGIEEQQKPAIKQEATLNPAYAGKKILIVEDQEGFLTTLENILVSMGIPHAQIHKAGNGREAVEYLQQNPDTSLTITDLRMPEMDGMQFLAVYSSTFKDQKPIIVVTGSYSNEEVAGLFQDKSLGELDLNLRYTIKGRFFSDNIRKLVDKALTEPAELADVEVKMPESLDSLPKVHSLNHLEELAVKRRGELYVLETNRDELLKLVDENASQQARALKTEFTPPKGLDLSDQHDYKTEIAAILVDNEERVRTIEATVKGSYESGNMNRTTYGRILSHLSLVEQATKNAFDYTVQIVKHLAAVDESAYSDVNIDSFVQKEILPELQKKYSKVSFSYEGESHKLSTSKQALTECLNALLDNAASYASNVTVSARTDDGYAVIRVEDNGPGVAEENRSKIFDPLFTTRANQGGTGVGLSLAKSHIEKLGGELNYVPKDKGACFEIKLSA
jgi:CheY-like chemotaxis protein